MHREEFKDICSENGWNISEKRDGKTYLSRTLENGKEITISMSTGNSENAVLLLAIQNRAYTGLTDDETKRVNKSLDSIAERILGDISVDVSAGNKYGEFKRVCERNGFSLSIENGNFTLTMKLKNTENYVSESLCLKNKEAAVCLAADSFHENTWAMNQVRNLSSYGVSEAVNIIDIADNAKKVKKSLISLSNELNNEAETDTEKCVAEKPDGNAADEYNAFEIVKACARSNGFAVSCKTTGDTEAYTFYRHTFCGVFISFCIGVDAKLRPVNKLESIADDLMSEELETNIINSFHEANGPADGFADAECMETVLSVHQIASMLRSFDAPREKERVLER